MRVYDNGVYRDATPEEEAEHQRRQAEFDKRPKPDPSPEERLSAIETELRDIQTAYEEGVNNA